MALNSNPLAVPNHWNRHTFWVFIVIPLLYLVIDRVWCAQGGAVMFPGQSWGWHCTVWCHHHGNNLHPLSDKLKAEHENKAVDSSEDTNTTGEDFFCLCQTVALKGPCTLFSCSSFQVDHFNLFLTFLALLYWNNKSGAEMYCFCDEQGV